jgi:hypothetical protein
MLCDLKEVQLHALISALNGMLQDFTPAPPTGRPVGLRVSQDLVVKRKTSQPGIKCHSSSP